MLKLINSKKSGKEQSWKTIKIADSMYAESMYAYVNKNLFYASYKYIKIFNLGVHYNIIHN